MTPDLRGRLLRADVLHTPVMGQVQALADALVDIATDGTIASVTPADDPTHADRIAAAGHRLVTVPPGTVLLPGLIDLHIHAPQYPQLGTALDVPLEVWLHQYTFPLEARYADLGFADRLYSRLVADLLAGGTTTAVYFATIHDAATCRLADICIDRGQRAFVGRVAMDHPDTCPDHYRDASVDAAITGTRIVIDHIRAHPGNADARVRPMVCPRFIPACTDDLLAALGDLAHDTGTAVTTHVSESDWEHAHVATRTGVSDATALDQFGLMPPGSVLAHGVFLSDDDLRLIGRRQAGVAHCPWSNAYFAGAAFPLRRALALGTPVGLGSDISGGPGATVWEAARTALITARMLESGTDPDLPPDARSRHAGARITAATAFWLATAGGAQVLGIPTGTIAPGQRMDALLIDPAALHGGLADWPEMGPEAPERRLERLLHGTARANITHVFVDGRRVAGAG
jgi:guanine deaminase